MTQGETHRSGGELSSFLHLTGFRPVVLALVAGLAGAVGVFLALQAPAEFQARYVLNVARVADNDLTLGELDIFVEEVISTASFPEVHLIVEDETELVFEDDYQIVVNRANGAQVNINVVAADPTQAENVAVETAIAAVTLTTERELGGVESSRDQLLSDLAEVDADITGLIAQADGLNPTVALDNAQAALLRRKQYDRNPPVLPQPQPDGTVRNVVVPPTDPPVEEIEEDIDKLTPIAREFVTIQTREAALNVTLADRNDAIRELRSAREIIEAEREASLALSRVETEETSRLTGLLTGLLIFAVPAALVVIFLYTLIDLIRRKPEEPLAPQAEFDAAGELESHGQRALPEATIRRPLTVVDEDEQGDLLDDDDIIDVVAKENDDDFDDDEPPTKKSKRSKDGRWGRDASSKAG